MVALWVLAIFLAMNAAPWTPLGIIAWGFAALYVIGSLLTRTHEIAIPKGLAAISICPVLLIFLGAFGIYHNDLRDFLKDCWYFSNPLCYMAFGYFIAERLKGARKLIATFTIVGIGASVYSIVKCYFHASELADAASVNSYRHITGTGTGQAMIPIVLLLIARHVKLPLGTLEQTKPVRLAVYILGTAAVALSLSRTLLIVLLCGVMVLLRKRTLFAVATGAVFAGMLGVFATSLVSQSFFHAAEPFKDKVLHSSQEVQLHPYETFKDINDNWRGFEAYRAMQTYRRLPFTQKIIGGGFGTMVDIGFAMLLGGNTPIQELPLLHNGYMYLLVKTGVVGLSLFLVFVGQIVRLGLRYKHSNDKSERLAGYVLIWTALVFLLTQGVITGIYNKGGLAPNLLLLGAMIAIIDSRSLKTAIRLPRTAGGRDLYDQMDYRQRLAI
jgi:O-Antigen ligase